MCFRAEVVRESPPYRVSDPPRHYSHYSRHEHPLHTARVARLPRESFEPRRSHHSHRHSTELVVVPRVSRDSHYYRDSAYAEMPRHLGYHGSRKSSVSLAGGDYEYRRVEKVVR